MDPCLKWEELFQTMLVFENYPEEEADERVQAGGKVTSNIKIALLLVSIVHGQTRASFFDFCGNLIVSLHVADKTLVTVACNLAFLVDIKSCVFQ